MFNSIKYNSKNYKRKNKQTNRIKTKIKIIKEIIRLNKYTGKENE